MNTTDKIDQDQPRKIPLNHLAGLELSQSSIRNSNNFTNGSNNTSVAKSTGTSWRSLLTTDPVQAFHSFPSSTSNPAYRFLMDPAASLDQSKNKSFLVPPAEALDERCIQLSVLDKFVLPIYLPFYFIYERLPLDGFEVLVSKLTESLAGALVPFYPFAGRMEMNPATGCCELRCDNRGAQFRIIYSEKELSNTCFTRPCHQLWLLAPKLNAVPVDGGPRVPALSIQVTKFNCGSVAICSSFHHQAADAYAGSLFMQAWSQLANSKPLEIVPVHDRWSLMPDEDLEKEPATRPPTAIVGTKPSATNGPASRLSQHSEADFGDSGLEGYLFDSASIAQLKAMAPGATSFEAVTAFMARHAIKTKQKLLPDGAVDDGLAKFVLMVDFRNRLSATAYTGNAALPKAIVCPRVDFLEGPLSIATGLVHEAVATSDTAYFRAFVRYASRGPPQGERALAVSSCARLPLYGAAADFGWGLPTFAGIVPPLPKLVPEFLALLPACPSCAPGALVAFLQLQSDVLQAVDNDPEFRSIAKKYRPLEEQQKVVRSKI